MATTRNPRNRRSADDNVPVEADPDPLLSGLDDLEPAGEFATMGQVDWNNEPWYQRLNLKRVVAPAAVAPLAILFGLNAVDELDRMAFSVLTPEIKHAFGLSLSGVLAIQGVVLIVNLILELPIGYLADRKNRVRMATGGAFFWGIFSMLTGLSIGMTSLGLLYIARLGSAIAKNLNTTHRSLLSDYYP